MTAATANTAAPVDPRAAHRPAAPSSSAGASDATVASGFNALVDLASYKPGPVKPSPLPVSPAPNRLDPSHQNRAPQAPRAEPREPAQTATQDTATGTAGSDASRSAKGRASASIDDPSKGSAPQEAKDRSGGDDGSVALSDTTDATTVSPTPMPTVAPVIAAATGSSANGTSSAEDAFAGGDLTSAPAPNPAVPPAPVAAAATGGQPVGQRDGMEGQDVTDADGQTADGADIAPTLSTLLGATQTPGPAPTAAGPFAAGAIKSAPLKTLASAGSTTGPTGSAGSPSIDSAAVSLLSGGPDGAIAPMGDRDGGHGTGQEGPSSGGADTANAAPGSPGAPSAEQTPFTPSFDASPLAAQLASAAGGPTTTAGLPGAPQGTAPSRTVTGLASQIIQNVDSKITRFEVALDPEGMGRVNVSVEISAKGEMSARLSFQHPEAANAMASESLALRQSLQDAGFTLKPEDLTFQSGSQGGAGGFNGSGFGASDEGQRQASGSAAAFGAMNRLADLTDLSAMGAASGAAARGLDIRI